MSRLYSAIALFAVLSLWYEITTCDRPTQENKAALAPVLNKKFKLSHSENFDDVMKALGVGIIIRQLANVVSPIIELTESNGEYTLAGTSKSAFKDTALKFKIGEEFEEETLDGRNVKSIITQEGNKLTHIQKGAKVTKIVRVFSPEKIKMVITVDNITCIRIYKPYE